MNLQDTIDIMAQTTNVKPAMSTPIAKHFDSQPGGEMLKCKMCGQKVQNQNQAYDHLKQFHDDPIVQAREFSQGQRKKLAKKGEAMPGGGFPIVNEHDLANAKRAIGRAKNPAAARAHINERAKALGAKPIGAEGQFSPSDRLNMPAPAGTKERSDQMWKGPGQIQGLGFKKMGSGQKCGNRGGAFHRGAGYDRRAADMGHRLTLAGMPFNKAVRRGSPKLSAERSGYKG
jgi:predicted nucleic acid-binding Zn ribbon protein